MRHDTKLARIRELMRDGDWDNALKLAARFQRLGEHAAAIRRAAGALASPAIYEELGFDLATVRAEGITAMKRLYSKSWKESQGEEGSHGK